MSQNDYLGDRAEQELRMARRARSPQAKKAHYELAGLLFDAFHNPEWTWPGTRDEIRAEDPIGVDIVTADWFVREQTRSRRSPECVIPTIHLQPMVSHGSDPV